MNGTSTSPLGTPPVPQHPWRLVRARNDKVAGVCAGLAAASGIDVTLVRVAFVLAGLGGFGVIAYLVLIFVVPKEDPAKGDFLVPAPANVAQWIRVALGIGAVVGTISLIDDGPPFMGDRDGFGFGLGLLMLGVGALVIWARRGRPGLPTAMTSSGTNFPPPSAAPMTPPSPVTPSPTGPMSWPQPSAQPSAQPGAWPEPGTTTSIPVVGATDTDRTTAIPYSPAPAPPMPFESVPRTGGAVIAARVFGWLTVIATLPIAVAVGALVRVRALSLPVPFLFLVLAAAVVINLIVWSSIAKRVAFVLVAMSLPFVLASAVALASHWNGDIGERTEQPTTRADASADFRMAIGHQVIDLSRLDVTGDPVTVRADHRIGLLEVVVPDGATVKVESSVSAGVIDLFGTERDGATISYDTTSGTSETSRFELDLEVGYGRLDVCRVSDARMVGGTMVCSSAP